MKGLTKFVPIKFSEMLGKTTAHWIPSKAFLEQKRKLS